MNNQERNIRKRLHDFDLISLLRLLKFKNYSLEEIRFKGHISTASQAGLFHDIEFYTTPTREVVITMNLGLLSAQSPLPSYFLKKIDYDILAGNAFADFIAFFDHQLIKNYIYNIYPEINKFFFPSWTLTKRRYLHLLNFKSSSNLHFLFQNIFPEINVEVQKALQRKVMQTKPIRLGKSLLGEDAIFGSKTTAWIHGCIITLYCEDETTENQVPWPKEIKSRLTELVFPILGHFDIDLQIDIVMKSRKRWARLHNDTYLGYDRIRSKQASYRRIRIFKGHVI